MDDRQLAAVPQRLERLQRRMQGEAAIQIDRRIWRRARTRDVNARAQLVVTRLEERRHHVQTISSASLEDDDEDALLAAALCGSSQEPSGRRSEDAGGHGGRAEEQTSARHGYLF